MSIKNPTTVVPIPNDREHFRLLDPPALDDRCGVGALMASDYFSNGGIVVRPGGLDGQLLHVAGEECLAHDRVVDEVEHVGCIAPQIRGGGIPHFGAQLAPGGSLVAPVPSRICSAKKFRHRITYGLVYDEAIAAGLHKWQVEKVQHDLTDVTSLEHACEERFSDPPHHRGSL
jgi:hypothetical protein